MIIGRRCHCPTLRKIAHAGTTDLNANGKVFNYDSHTGGNFGWGLEFPSVANQINIPNAGFDPDDIAILLIALGSIGAGRDSWETAFPDVDLSIQVLNAGGTILILGDFLAVNGSQPGDPAPTYLAAIGTTMSFDVAGGTYPPGIREQTAVIAHALTAGMTVWETNGAGKLLVGDGSSLCNHSSGGSVLGVENVAGGKVVISSDTGSMEEGYTMASLIGPGISDAELLLHNVYYNVAGTSQTGTARKTGFWGTWTNDVSPMLWEYRLPQGYPVTTGMADADLTTSQLGTVWMGYSGGATTFDIPSDADASIEFLNAGGTICITAHYWEVGFDLVNADAVACNVYLAAIGCTMTWNTLTSGTQTTPGTTTPETHALTTGIGSSEFYVGNAGAIIVNDAVGLVTKNSTSVVAVEYPAGGGTVVLFTSREIFTDALSWAYPTRNPQLLVNLSVTQTGMP